MGGCSTSQMVKSGKTSTKPSTLVRIETGYSDATIRESGHPALVPGGCRNVTLHDSDAQDYYIKQHTAINSFRPSRQGTCRLINNPTDDQDHYLKRHLTIHQDREDCQNQLRCLRTPLLPRRNVRTPPP